MAVGEGSVSSLGRSECGRLATYSPELCARLAGDGRTGLVGVVTVLGDAADARLAARTLQASGCTGTVDPTGSTRGGLTVVANDGTMYRRYTVEDRLEKYSETGRASVAGALFG